MSRLRQEIRHEIFLLGLSHNNTLSILVQYINICIGTVQEKVAGG